MDKLNPYLRFIAATEPRTEKVEDKPVLKQTETTKVVVEQEPEKPQSTEEVAAAEAEPEAKRNKRASRD